MDIQAQVAARRAELARIGAQAKAAEAARKEEHRAAEKAKREKALDAVARRISATETVPPEDDDDLDISLHELRRSHSGDSLPRSDINSLIHKEVRKRWTSSDKWTVIGCVALGLCLLTIPLLGIPMIMAGFFRLLIVNKGYRNEIMREHPDLLESNSSKLN